MISLRVLTTTTRLRSAIAHSSGARPSVIRASFTTLRAMMAMTAAPMP